MSKVARLKDYPPFEGAVLKLVYQHVKRTPKDGQWRVFKGKVMVKETPYNIELTFRLAKQFMEIESFSVKNFTEKFILPSTIN